MIEIKAVTPEIRYHTGPIPSEIIAAFHEWRRRVAYYASLHRPNSRDRQSWNRAEKAAREVKSAEHHLRKLLLPHRGVRFRFGKSAVWIDASDIRDRVRIEELP